MEPKAEETLELGAGMVARVTVIQSRYEGQPGEQRILLALPSRTRYLCVVREEYGEQVATAWHCKSGWDADWNGSSWTGHGNDEASALTALLKTLLEEEPAARKAFREMDNPIGFSIQGHQMKKGKDE